MRALRSATSTACSRRPACAATRSSTAVSSPRRGPINEVYAEFFGAHKPGRLVATVPELHFGCLVEIEAVAELDEN